MLDGTVLGAFTRAVVIGVATPDGPRVISLLGPSAAAVPNGVRLGTADSGLLGRYASGDAVSVGAGRIRLGGVQVRVVRTWPCRVPRTPVERRSIDTIAEVAAARPLGVPGECVAALTSALESELPLRTVVRGLIGRGIGLTPGGDDLVAGTLCGLWASGASDAARALAAAALVDVTDRTTLLSADLLRLAAGGEACLELLGVLRAAHRGRDLLPANPSALARALDRLLQIGHTSGADLAIGLAVGLQVGSTAVAPDRSEAR